MRKRLLLLGYLTIVAFLLAHLINTWMAEAISGLPSAMSSARIKTQAVTGPQDNLPKMAEEILASGLFPAAKMEAPATDLASGGVTGNLRPAIGGLDAAKKVKLVGTVVTEGIIPFAVIEDLATKRQTLYHLSENVPNVGAIVEVRPDAVMLKQGAVKELLELNPSQAAPAAVAKTTAPAAPTNPAKGSSLRKVLDQREVAQSMADLPKLLSEARVGPFYANGKVEGWKIEGITPKSFYERIGLQAGDVLQRVNGVEIRDPGMVLSLFQQLKDEKSVSLDMLREGQKTTMNYEIR